MTQSRKIWLFLLMVVVIIQFIQPKKNISQPISASDISKVYDIPASVHELFLRKCYDCHSNHTRYPWYFHVQPIGWWLAAHVHEGKEDLNFSEFRSYGAEKADDKLEEIVEVVREREMPIRGYVWLHPRAAITSEDEQAIHSWVDGLRMNNN